MSNTTTTTATYYDHSLNCRPAVGAAMARARREVLAEGVAWTVTAKWSHQPAPFFWNGCKYDVIALAKQLVNNRAEFVTVEKHNGETLTEAKIKDWKF